MNNQAFRGTGVALVTPFAADQSIDYAALERIIEHVIEGGVEYIVSLGTTGEAITLPRAECKQVLRFTHDHIAGRVPMVAGLFGANSTDVLLERVNAYNLGQFDAIMASSPAYNKPSQEGIYQHYLKLEENSEVPIIIYNVPGRTCSNVLPQTVLRLAHHSDKFIAVKEASGNLEQAMSVIKGRPDNFLVISGDDTLTVPMASVGGDGAISVIANAFPKEFSDMTRAALNNNFAEAAQLNSLLLDVHPWLYLEGNPVGIKGALEILGICNRRTRLPLTPLSEASFASLQKEIAKVQAAMVQ